MGARATGLGSLIGTFHGRAWTVGVRESGKPRITARMSFQVNDLAIKDRARCRFAFSALLWITSAFASRLHYNRAALEELVHNERRPLAAWLQSAGRGVA